MAVMPEDPRDVLKRGSPDIHRLDDGAKYPAAIEQCVQSRMRKGAAEDFQTLLTPTHSRQPVMHEGDPQAGQAAVGGRRAGNCERSLAKASVHARAPRRLPDPRRSR